MSAVLIIAAARDDIADFLGALLLVYIILIFAYIIASLVQSFGRIPYARWSSALIGFLHDVCEPYLRIFRRFIPPIGPLDISPIVAILVLQIVGGILISVVRG